MDMLLLSGNLRHARGLDDWRPPLAFRELGGFFLVGVDAAKGLPIRVIYRYQVVMMTAAPVFSKLGLSVAHRFSRRFTG
jgi:hypothetical protein